jgi:hypothetical protein
MLAANQAGMAGQGDGGTGFGKVLCYKPGPMETKRFMKCLDSPRCRRGLFIFIGVCEFIGGVGQQARVERRTLQISFRSMTSPLS